MKPDSEGALWELLSKYGYVHTLVHQNDYYYVCLNYEDGGMGASFACGRGNNLLLALSTIYFSLLGRMLKETGT